MDKKLFSISALWFVLGSAFAMLILVLIYKMAYFSAFGIDGSSYISFSELFASMVEPWAIVIGTVIILVFLTIWSHNILLFSRPIGVIRNSKWAEKERESRKKILERRTQLQAKGHVTLFYFFMAVIILVLCLAGVIKQHEKGSEMGMSNAILLLLLPIAFFTLMELGAKSLAVIIGTSEVSVKTDKNVLRTFVELVAPLFIYAVALFYLNGYYCGEDSKSRKQATFEVRAVDGSLYADDAYVYVGQSHHGDILLYNWNTSKTVILNGNTIDQIQFETNSVQNSALLREWMEKLIAK